MLTVHAEHSEESCQTPSYEKGSHLPHTKGKVFSLVVPHVKGRTQDGNAHSRKEDLEGMIAFACLQVIRI